MKRARVNRLLCAVPVFLVVSSARLLGDTAIVGALLPEVDGVEKAVRLVGKPIVLAQHKISIGYHKGEKIYIVRTGAGIVNATMTTQALLTRYRLDRLISIGVAGNLRDDWKIGDIMIATSVVNHQQGKESASGFEAKANVEPSSGGQLSRDYVLRCEQLRSDVLGSSKGRSFSADKERSRRRESEREAGKDNGFRQGRVHRLGRFVHRQQRETQMAAR